MQRNSPHGSGKHRKKSLKCHQHILAISPLKKFIPESIVPFKLLDSYIDYWPSGTEDENVLNF